MRVQVISGHQKNRPPEVDAGEDKTVMFPNSLKIEGNVKDDGLPVPPGSIEASWKKVAGPGKVAFDPNDQPQTEIRFSEPGKYILRLTANDGQLERFDDLFVIVEPRNERPQVNAGDDFSVRLPGFGLLKGRVSDDGLPVPPGKLELEWRLEQGPSEVNVYQHLFCANVGLFLCPWNVPVPTHS